MMTEKISIIPTKWIEKKELICEQDCRTKNHCQRTEIQDRCCLCMDISELKSADVCKPCITALKKKLNYNK
jgi:hypothetical protein